MHVSREDPLLRRTQHRMRLLAACVLLTAVTFQQDPGRLAPDTKLDMVVDPVRFMGRALHLWEPLGYFGQVQNQAYGYLFPMGPFFAAGRLAQLPPWVVQRLWVSLLLCLAFLGVVRLARLLGVGGPSARIAAGLAYALAPRMITVLGAASIEALPMAMAPWVLVPLVRGAVSGSPRRAAALSGVAILCTGGVNAAASIAVLPLPALWLATRRPGVRRRQLTVWWASAVVLATLWWVVPLLLLGRYSPPFLGFIESARVTTSATNLTEVLRGTSHWLALLADNNGPVWRAGWLLMTTPALIVDTVVVAGVGMLGLARRDMPERTWAVLGLLAGVLLVGFGHVGAGDGLLAGLQRDLLDGVLAPLRNVHKYDPVLRLPIALGLGHVLSVVSARLRGSYGSVTRFAVYAGVAAALAGVAAPMLVGRLTPRGDFAAVPGYWQQAADYLARAGGQGRALLLPGSRFGQYYWGEPRDEPLQALARTPWAVRDAVPLAPPGNIRMLDAVEQRLATGTGSDGLAPYLSRAGVRYLVVRNDLDYAKAGSPRPALVHQALAESPGIRRVAQFGPFVGGGGGRSDILVDEGLDRPYPAVEVFAVQPSVGQVQAYPLDEVPVVSGGPESILALADRQWLQGRPTVLAGDAPSWLVTSESVVTDGMRRREVTFGRLEGDASDVLAPSDPRRLSGTSRDYLPWPGSDRHETVAQVVGASSLSASSSASDANAFGGPRPEHQPFAALDGDAATSWLSAGLGGAVGQWLEVRLDRPADLRQVQVDLDPSAPGPPVTRILVTTDRGSVPARVGASGGPVVVRLPAGPTSRVRVTATAVQGGGRGFVVGISELHLPGVQVTRPLVTPADLPAAAPLPLVALDAAGLERTGCVRLGSRPLCTRGLAQPGEDERGLDRIVRLAQAGAYDVVATVVPRPGTALNARLAAAAPGIVATASSSQVSDPAGSPQAAVDRDLGTGWVARSGDPAPTLVLRLPQRRRITGVQLVVDQALAASLPREVQVSVPGVRLPRVGMLDGTGTLRFAALTTDKVEISFPSLSGRSTYDPFDKVVSFMPVGVSEVRLIGADDLRRPAPGGDRSSPCGQGPTLSIGGVQVPTRVTASAADLRSLAEVIARPCAAGPVRLLAGDTRIVATRTALWSVVGLSLVPAGTSPTTAASSAAAVPVQVRSWGRTTRQVALPARSRPFLLVVHENQNDGWSAVADGKTLTPLTVDGWQQGWIVPAGPATRVSLTFGPDRTYQMGLGGGALAALLLLVAAAWPAGSALRPAGAHSRARRVPAGVRAGLLLAALLLAGGPLAGGIGVVLVAARAGLRARGDVVLGAVAAASLLVAGLLLAASPWNSSGYAGNQWPAQVAAVTALAAVGAAWVGRLQRPNRFLWRMTRRSMRR